MTDPARRYLALRVAAYRRSLRNDRSSRISLFVTVALLLGTLVIAYWSQGYRPGASSQGNDDSATRLRTGGQCLAAAMGFGLFAAMSSLSSGLTSDVMRLIAQLPIGPARRYQIYLVHVLLGSLLPIAIGGALTSAVVLSPYGPLWPVVGALSVVWGVIAGSVVPVVWQAGPGRLASVVVIVGLLAAALATWGLTSFPNLTLVLLIVGLTLSCLTLTFFAAEPLGRVFVTAFERVEGPPQIARPVRNRLISVVLMRLRPYRTTFAAVVCRDLLDQSRDRFLSFRWIVFIVGPILGFVLTRSSLLDGLSSLTLVVVLGAALGAYTTLDFTPCPISAEGHRYTLYVVGRADSRQFVQARIVSTTAFAAMVAMYNAVALGLLLGLSLWTILAGALIAPLLTAVATVLTTAGSAWDERLDAGLEGDLATMMHEHIPFTATRILNLGIAMGTLAILLLLAWTLGPLLSAAAALVVLVLVSTAGTTLAARRLDALTA